MKVFIGFADALAKWIHTLDDELRWNVVLNRAFISKPPKHFRSNGAGHSTWCGVSPHVNVVTDTVLGMYIRVGLPGSRNVKFSAPLQAGIVERQPGCIRPNAVELLADPQQSRHSGYREVMVVGVTARNQTNAKAGTLRISLCRR